MLVVMQQGATDQQIQAVIDRLVAPGFTVHRFTGVMHTVCSAAWDPVDETDPADFEAMEGVKECHRIVSPYKLVSRRSSPKGQWSESGRGNRRTARGSHGRAVQRGESRSDRDLWPSLSWAQGAQILRGGAFKPRSSPYSFQGLSGKSGLQR